MSTVNKVILIGNLGQDPEVRYTPSGAAVVNLSLATSRSWKNKDSGEKMEETEWHRCVAYDRLAEICGEYLRKGGKVYVEGRLKTRKYQQDGVDKYTTEIIVEEMRMLSGREDRDSGSNNDRQRERSSGNTQQQQRPQQQQQRSSGGGQRQQPQQRSGGGGSSGFDDMDDDIPFVTASPCFELADRKAKRMGRCDF